MNESQEFAWLDVSSVEGAALTGLEQRADIMREGGQEGKDRIWWCDGEYIWFRRAKSNPATLIRHNNFVADGDYVHVETQGDVEVWQVKPQSQFSDPGRAKQIDIGAMNTYNVRRQAALAAVRRDWPGFRDIMTYLRERINAKHGANAAGAELEYAEQYMAVIASIVQRNGPSAGEISTEILALMQKNKVNMHKMITVGGNA